MISFRNGTLFFINQALISFNKEYDFNLRNGHNPDNLFHRQTTIKAGQD